MGSPNMHDERIRKVLARNLKSLLTHAEMSQYALAQKTKNISQKQINNIAEARTGCGIDALVEIAAVLSVPAWVLLYEQLPEAVNSVPALAQLADAFAKSSEGDRNLLTSLARKVR